MMVCSARQEGNPINCDSVVIAVDGQRLATDCHDIRHGMCALMATYYLLNIQFPLKIQKTLTFFEEYIFCLGSGGKVSTTITRLYNELEKSRNEAWL